MSWQAIRSGWWWFVLFKGSNGWLAAVLAAFLGFTDGAEWHSGQMQYARLVMFCFLAGSKFLDAWVDQTFGSIKKDWPDTAAVNGGKANGQATG